MRSSLFCYHEWTASQGPDWGEKRPLPQASAQGGRPGKDKGACIHAIICLLRARLPLNTFSVKARSSAEWPHIVKSLPRPFPFFLYPAASTSRVRYFADTAAIRCPHPSMAARPPASAFTAPARWRKANSRSAGRRATLSGFRLCSCRQGPDRTQLYCASTRRCSVVLGLLQSCRGDTLSVSATKSCTRRGSLLSGSTW